MSEAEPVWIVLARDLSDTITIQEQPQVMVAMVIDAETGLIRGVSVGATIEQACAEAATTALNMPASSLPPRPPKVVLYDQAHATQLLAALGETLPEPSSCKLVPGPPPAEAEAVFDAMLSHFAGPPNDTAPRPASAVRSSANAVRPNANAVRPNANDVQLPEPADLGPIRTARLRVTLREAAPAVVRVLDVPATATLPELHDLLQVGIGWTDSHLHEFDTGTDRYGPILVDAWDDEELRDEATATLRDLPARFLYRYDFGDNWQHDIEVLGRGGQPGCVYGEGACPPEDCGGVGGYSDLLEALADPTHPDHDQLRQWSAHWSPDWTEADRLETDRLVRATVGQVPASVRLLLDLIGDKVRLTPGGRLPRALVRAVQEQRPGWSWWGKPAAVEEDLPALAELHDLLRQVGLLRLARGELMPTKAASHDLEIIRRLRRTVEPEGFDDILAGVAVAHLTARGPLPRTELAALTHPWLERWAVNGKPITPDDVDNQLMMAGDRLVALDLVRSDGGTWHPGPSAGSLLPRAIGLARILAQSVDSEPG
jgi:hypothetical protein